jgi:hypothetical protein
MANKIWIFLVCFLLSSLAFGQDYILFINGYRGPKHDHETTNNQLNFKDPTGYWYALDDTIQRRFPGAKSIYLDAHHPLNTSTHLTLGKAVRSYVFSRFCWIEKESHWVLNQNLNKNGFEIRVENGRKAGKLLKQYLSTQTVGKVHIVCHSMGYAYMLGIMDMLENQFTFGKALILSPEAANTAGRNWALFEEVWQYGANADVKEADPICFQDGIAPQKAVVGIERLPNSTKGGRIYIPKSYPKRKLGFIKSHHLAYYDWFFWIKPEDNGYFSAD